MRREQASCARLRGGDRAGGHARVSAQQRRDLLVHGAAVLGEELLDVALGHRRDERVVRRLRVGLLASDDLDLAPFLAGRHLQALELHALALCLPQRLGDLRLGSERPTRRFAVRRG